MSTPPGSGPPDEGGRDDWETPPPPPEPTPPDQPDQWGDSGQQWEQPGQRWDQPAQQWDQPTQEWGQAGQQPAWDQQQWGAPPGPGYGAPQTNGLAIGALVASVLGFFCGVGFIVGLILGYNARNQIRASGGRQTGEGIATAAIVIGWVGVALMVLAVLLFVVVLGWTMPAGM